MHGYDRRYPRPGIYAGRRASKDSTVTIMRVGEDDFRDQSGCKKDEVGVGDEKELSEIHAAFGRLVRDSAVAPSALAELFDGLSGDMRSALVRRLGRGEQRALYEKVDGFAPLTLVDLVPANRGDDEEVRHLGFNTLPAFRVFEKRFARASGQDPAAPTTLAGYNFQAMSALTGPGYFEGTDDTDRAEVLVDYHRLPTTTPAGWPPVRSNERGLSRFVYGFMIDRLRRVSKHVTIGSASRKGKDLGSYFALTRSD